ncbi:MAG: hypothetical protein JW942_05620 [Opitutales bacterium]|nr:hypothetical protein [Opitutales bacterium]
MSSLDKLGKSATEKLATAFDRFKTDRNRGIRDGDDAQNEPNYGHDGGKNQEVGEVADLDRDGAFDLLACQLANLGPVGGFEFETGADLLRAHAGYEYGHIAQLEVSRLGHVS